MCAAAGELARRPHGSARRALYERTGLRRAPAGGAERATHL